MIFKLSFSSREGEAKTRVKERGGSKEAGAPAASLVRLPGLVLPRQPYPPAAPGPSLLHGKNSRAFHLQILLHNQNDLPAAFITPCLSSAAACSHRDSLLQISADYALNHLSGTMPGRGGLSFKLRSYDYSPKIFQIKKDLRTHSYPYWTCYLNIETKLWKTYKNVFWWLSLMVIIVNNMVLYILKLLR